ncbi:MAG: hypothetical protein WDM91_04410 [Rhizomicrobium sp.]
MLVVAGGQYDPNIGWLLRRVLARGVAFADILNGPTLKPDVVYDFARGGLTLSGKSLKPTGLFIRHNVFLEGYSDPAEAHAEALNWFYFLRGWACADPAIRCFNRSANGAENNKVENLHAARAAGLRIPETTIACAPPPTKTASIRKPVAGGELTEALDEGRRADPPSRWRPYFHQARLGRPELRVFVIGRRLFGCALTSAHVDYRDDNDTKLEPAKVPKAVGLGLLALCETLQLDFAAADFMLDGAGRYRFLEINTQPMFIAFDKALGGALCDAIIDHLAAPP